MIEPISSRSAPAFAAPPRASGATLLPAQPAGMLDQLRQSWRRLREQRSLRNVARRWRAVRAGVAPAHAASRPPRTLLLVPSDPWTLVGAGGDDAMLGAAVTTLRAGNPSLAVAIVTATDAASHAARARGFRPVQIWARADFVDAVLDLLARERPDALVALGADIVDGAYGANPAVKLLVLADLAARAGTAATLLGFSFSATPHAAIRPVLDELSPAVRLNLRDEISLRRFRAFTSARCQLVADSAFLMPPGEAVAPAADWIADRKAHGRTVIGFNLHPTLFKDAAPSQVAALIAASAAALAEISAERPVSWLMFPHDYRRDHGDDVCLAPLAAALAPRLGPDVFHLAGEHSAAALKAVAGRLDGVVAGRMHLAIASLGMGVPVVAVTYQDKFEGLFRHFGLPSWLLLPPARLLGPDALRDAVIRFVDELAPLGAQVRQALPAVLAASRLNLADLAASGQAERAGGR